MLKRLISIFVLSAMMFCQSFSLASAENDFTPTLRFVVASDMHIADSGSDIEEKRLAELFKTSYSYAESQSYKKVDGVFCVGDISDRGTSSSMEKFFDIVNANLRSETKFRAVLGNHEFYTDSANTVSRFLAASGYTEADTDFVLGGYHFVMMCPENGGRGYSSSQKSWLKKRLSEDAKEDSTKRKPIFVFQHHNVSGTVYGSEAWGIGEISSLLSQYPQVVDFSGHSHYPINDPRSVWQGSFTALNDGTLSYYEMGIAGVADGGIYPCDNSGGYSDGRNHRDAAQYYIVEVDKNNAIRVKGYDLISNAFICEYNIPSVGNTNEFVYTDARKAESTAPYFDSSASITLKGVRTNAAVFQIPQAKGADIVQHYRFDVYDLDNKLISTEYALSDTFYFPTPTILRCAVNGLQRGTDYTVRCYAVNCWGKESAPLTLKFRTSNAPDEVVCYNSPVTPDVFSFVQCENGAAYDGVSGTELAREGEPITYNDYITGRCAAEFNGINSYRFDGFKDKYIAMQNSVSFEYYGELNEIDFLEGSSYVDIFSNQEGGGCGFELSPGGLLEFYVHVGGKYVHPGIEVEFGKPVHAVGTFDGRTAKVYVNGVLASYETARGTLAFPSNENAQFLCIGGDSNSDGSTEACFTGKIVTANVYSKALSAYEIEQLYNRYNTFDFITESGYKFDLQKRKLFGLDLTKLTASEVENAFANNNLYVEADGKIGTGTKIVLKDQNNEVYDMAEVVVFGDVNGDGWYDGMDAVIVACISKGLLSEQLVGSAGYMAADCNHDGVIDDADVDVLHQAGVLLKNVDQSKSTEELLATSAEYVEYLNLIDQTVCTDKTVDTTENNCILVLLGKILCLIKNAIDFVKSVFLF